MGKYLSEQTSVVNNVEIVKHGEKLILPETLGLDEFLEFVVMRVV